MRENKKSKILFDIWWAVSVVLAMKKYQAPIIFLDIWCRRMGESSPLGLHIVTLQFKIFKTKLFLTKGEKLDLFDLCWTGLQSRLLKSSALYIVFNGAEQISHRWSNWEDGYGELFIYLNIAYVNR